ncbi:hypothetical protein AB0283_10030 [Micromonospora vinacea]|uniref:hypothetical protein n=1 Tax=Micromonospora vinacea TaxID=709878 RepID=UPI00344E12FA
MLDKDAGTFGSGSAGTTSPRAAARGVHRSRLGTKSLLGVTNGVLAGVGGVYLATVSVPVTVVAAVSAVVLVSLIVIVHR